MLITRFRLPSPLWEAARLVRQEVFVIEQECPPEEEWDGFDADAFHVLGTVDDAPIATARWRVVQSASGSMAKLERFAVREAYRGQGYGRDLVAATLADAKDAGYGRFTMNAQAHLAEFYTQFGFQRTGPEFDEVGIPHIMMVRVH